MFAFDPVGLLTVLARHKVDFVVIGGIAATLQGSILRTNDVDICPKKTTHNAQRLSAAITEIGGRLRTKHEPLGVAFPHDAEVLLGQAALTLITSFGNFDISWVPSGTDGYADFMKSSEAFEIEAGLTVEVAALADIIRSKEAAGREKDRAALPTLRRLLEIHRLRGSD